MTTDRTPQPPLRILVVNPDVPPPDRDSGSLRLFRVIEMLLADGHHVSLLARDGLGDGQERAAEALRALGVSPVITFDLQRAAQHNPGWQRAAGIVPPLDLPGLLRDGRYDLAWLSFFHVAEQYTPLIRTYSPATAIVVDSVDIHHVRESRGALLSRDERAMAAAAQTLERERHAYGGADATVAVSDVDAAHLAELAPEVPRYVIPNIHPVPDDVPRLDDRSDVLFVGNFRHAPNVDAILWFHETCWPRVRAGRPGAHLRVVGTEPPEPVRRIAGPDVTVEGWVPAVEPYLERARVSIAPLRYGAGVKGKIGEAMAAGVPVVTTSIGNEGMDMIHGEQAMIADAPEAFAAAVLRLLEDDALWERLSRSARSLLARTMGVSAARSALAELLERLGPVRWQAPADAPWLGELLHAYGSRFGPGDPARLVLTCPAQDDDAGEAAIARVLAVADARRLDVESMADIDVVPWDEALPVPSRTVLWTPEDGGP